MSQQILTPILTRGLKSISDDDLCSGCVHCQQKDGDLSRCTQSWPGLENPDAYVGSPRFQCNK